MVKIHIKKGDESQFLYEASVSVTVDDLLKEVADIYNGRLKVSRVCEGIFINSPDYLHSSAKGYCIGTYLFISHSSNSLKKVSSRDRTEPRRFLNPASLQ